MEREDVPKLVAEVSKYFPTYRPTKDGNMLECDLGLTLFFRPGFQSDKGTICGLNAYGNHEIGCTFTKDPKKIAQDIKKRLLPKYRESFLKRKKADLKHDEKKEKIDQELKMFASLTGGKVVESYGDTDKKVEKANVEINNYYGKDFYVAKIVLTTSKMMKLAKFLKENDLINEKIEHL